MTQKQMTPRPQVAGDLTPEEKATLDQMKQRAQQIVLRIGSLEVEKSRLLMGLDQQEQMIQMHLQAIGKRLEIPMGAGWQVVNDKAIIVNPPPQATPPKMELTVVKDEAPEAPEAAEAAEAPEAPEGPPSEE